MRSRLTKLGVALGALVALAVGGSALASASHSSTPSAQPPFVAQSQQGDQAGVTDPADVADNPAEAGSGKADTDNLEQGDQAGNDQTAAEQTDSQTETADSESGPSDGPGGYADTNPNADTQQQGEH